MTTKRTSRNFHGLNNNLKEADEQALESALKELTSGIEKLDQESISAMQQRLDVKLNLPEA